MSSVALPATAARRARRQMESKWVRDAMPAVVFGAVLLTLWQLCAAQGITPETLPAPVDLARYLGETVCTADFWAVTGSTMLSWLLGFTVSVTVGIALGLLAGLSVTVDRMIQPIVEFCRPIPSVVYLPLVILVYGTEQLSVVILVLGAALWPVLLQTVAGVRHTDPVLRDMTRAYGLGPIQRMRWCVLPSAAPFIATGVRISATIALVVVITAELLGTGHGLGGVIATSYQTGSYLVLFGTSVAVAIIGLILDQVLGSLERRLLQWHPSYRGETQ